MLSKNFSRAEFACPCCGIASVDSGFIAWIQELRTVVGVPFFINSGYRCSAYNKQIGGAANSSHLRGMAADVSTANFKSQDLWLLIAQATRVLSGIGLYASHIHLDRRIDSKLWLEG